MKNHLPLKELQHKLLGLIKGSYRPDAEDDIYFKKVYESENLELIKVIILWWRQNHIERYCFFTSHMLIEMNQLQTYTARYFQTNNHSSFIEEIAVDFLLWIMQNGKGLVKLVARFEYGMIQIQKGNQYPDQFTWPCDPLMVIDGLIHGDFSLNLLDSGEYQMRISDKFKARFEVEQLQKEVAA